MKAKTPPPPGSHYELYKERKTGVFFHLAREYNCWRKETSECSGVFTPWEELEPDEPSVEREENRG